MFRRSSSPSVKRLYLRAFILQHRYYIYGRRASHIVGIGLERQPQDTDGLTATPLTRALFFPQKGPLLLVDLFYLFKHAEIITKFLDILMNASRSLGKHEPQTYAGAEKSFPMRLSSPIPRATSIILAPLFFAYIAARVYKRYLRRQK